MYADGIPGMNPYVPLSRNVSAKSSPLSTNASVMSLPLGQQRGEAWHCCRDRQDEICRCADPSAH